MTLGDILLAIFLVAAIFSAYALGYRQGVAWCVRELKPLQNALDERRKLRESELHEIVRQYHKSDEGE